MSDSPLPEHLLVRPAAIIAAHPDDEVLGVGTLLTRFRNLQAVVHVTDGAPRQGGDAIGAGVHSWQEYAALRRHELETAMQRAGVDLKRLVCFGYPDQQASFHLVPLSKRLAALFRRVRPTVVLTHSYEGGHPDHDACAAAVRFASLLLRAREKQPVILEFASYHRGPDGAMETERFLRRSRIIWRRPLSERQRQFKNYLLGSYASQQRVLCQFPIQDEPVRLAPEYDFRKPPHRGKLYYENFDWGVNGRAWRKRARRAMAKLGLSHNL